MNEWDEVDLVSKKKEKWYEKETLYLVITIVGALLIFFYISG